MNLQINELTLDQQVELYILVCLQRGVALSTQNWLSLEEKFTPRWRDEEFKRWCKKDWLVNSYTEPGIKEWIEKQDEPKIKEWVDKQDEPHGSCTNGGVINLVNTVKNILRLVPTPPRTVE